jgi:hypothetical protein
MPHCDNKYSVTGVMRGSVVNVINDPNVELEYRSKLRNEYGDEYEG